MVLNVTIHDSDCVFVLFRLNMLKSPELTRSRAWALPSTNRKRSVKIDSFNSILCVQLMKRFTAEDYVEYMRQVAAAAPKTPFILYDIDFVTGIQCKFI